MAAFMNGNENEIEPLKDVAAEHCISDQQQVKREPGEKCGARDRLPVFLEGIEKRKSFAERCRNFHKISISLALVASACGEPGIDSPPCRHALRHSIHNLPAPVDTIAARKIFWIAGAVLRVRHHRAVLANFDSFDG